MHARNFEKIFRAVIFSTCTYAAPFSHRRKQVTHYPSIHPSIHVVAVVVVVVVGVVGVVVGVVVVGGVVVVAAAAWGSDTNAAVVMMGGRADALSTRPTAAVAAVIIA